MIVFVPAYDEQTRTNLKIATKIKIHNSILLFDVKATRDELLKNINTEDNNIFFMSHGSANAIFYSQNEVAITCEDSNIIKKNKIFAFACHTASTLGYDIASNGNTWWGFTGAISAPCDDDESINIITPIFQYIVDNYAKIQSKSDINTIFKHIKELTENAQHQFDVLDECGFMDSRLCIEHLWNRLRVWYGDIPELHKHPSASKPDLIY